MRVNLKERAKALQTDIPAVFLAIRSKETPWFAKLLAWLTVAYALSPIDLIPDFIPVLGYLDDLLILPALVFLTVKCIPPHVWQRSRAKAKAMWQNGKPNRWYYALPVVLFWVGIAFLILKAFL